MVGIKKDMIVGQTSRLSNSERSESNLKRRMMVKMKKIVISILAGWLVIWGLSVSAWATPSTTYWTPSTSDIQAFGLWHITYDTYTTIGKNSPASGGGDFPTTYGLTVGVLPFEKLKMEVGFDIMEPTDEPLMFNAKLGMPEGALFEGSPALNLGIFNVGTKKNVTDYNIVDVIVGKTLPANLGRLHLGYYVGNSDVLKDSQGNEEEDGFMIGYDKYIYKDKVMFAADYASGDNAIGAGGFGLYYFFTPNISLLAGPVWFNDRALNGDTKWTLQLDINF
ncbi:MAG: hypothetical protein HYV48_01350 [Candidatus Omnitrophica bacterium]|nr:hypothetical protein [Candidatus Omnitrophota bacterium]